MRFFSYSAWCGTVSSLKISLNFIMAIAASPMQWGFFCALALSMALAVGNYLALRWARGRSLQQFLWVLVGGFLGRLVVFGLAMVVVWKLSELDGKTFTWTLLVSYLLFQFFETLLLQRYFKRAKSIPKA
jgi:hypothetical protein